MLSLSQKIIMAIGLLLPFFVPAGAQDYPRRPIQVIRDKKIQGGQ